VWVEDADILSVWDLITIEVQVLRLLECRCCVYWSAGATSIGVWCCVCVCALLACLHPAKRLA
jgi:hypothetical protein